MIDQIAFRNFKGLRSVDVSLEQFTVFVGPNASGKTSILTGLYYLSQLNDKEPGELFQEGLRPFMLYSRGQNQKELMVIRASSAKSSRRLTLAPPNLDREHVNYQAVIESVDSWSPIAEFTTDPKGENGWSGVHPLDPVRQQMSPAVLLQLEPARLASPSYSKEQEPQMGHDGHGLASVLVRMAGNRPDDFQELQIKLRAIIPSLNKIRFDRAPVRLRSREDDSMLIEYMGDVLLFDFQNAPNVPARMASDGTLLALAILTAVMTPERPRLILLDNIENGLHPSAQRELVNLLKLILVQNPELQIVATTHSPYLVDVLQPDQVRITTLGDDGSVACASLIEHPDYEKWKDEMLPGEFWSHIGEKWVHARKAVVTQ